MFLKISQNSQESIFAVTKNRHMIVYIYFHFIFMLVSLCSISVFSFSYSFFSAVTVSLIKRCDLHIFHFYHMKGYGSSIIFCQKIWYHVFLVFILFAFKLAIPKSFFLHYDISAKTLCDRLWVSLY